MSKITKIEEQKNKARVNIFVDDAFFCGLNKEIAVKFMLKEGKEIDEQKLMSAIFESETKSAFDKAIDYTSRRLHTKKELKDKLLKKQFSEDAVNAAIAKLESYHYVDDKVFVREFIQQNTKLSKRMLKEKLRLKGVDSSFIEGALEEIDGDTELERCMMAVEKFLKSRNVNSIKDRQKLYASLSRKGFGFETIKKSCKKLLNCEVEDDDMPDF